MLSRTTYDAGYVASCRKLLDEQVARYGALVDAAAAAARGDLDAAVAGFEPRLCELLVLERDQMFVHRARAVEGKDGNALNEVRLLCRAIMENDAVMVADKGIRLDPGRSVLGSEPGARLALTLDGVERLRDAYFADIERKFV